MKPSEMTAALELYFDLDMPAYIESEPGLGKSSIVHQLAARRNVPLIDIRASQFDPVDLRGIPVAHQGTTKWLTPSFLPTDGEGIIFLDELSSARPAVQAALYQLVLDRQIGDWKAPAGWRVFAAGNGEKDGCVVERMSKALTSRFVHLRLQSDPDDWTLYAGKAGLDMRVIALLRFKPELLHKFDAKSPDKAFPCPRTWEMLSKVVKANPPVSTELELLGGIVGAAPAAEAVAFFRVFRNAPNLDAIILAPDTAVVPTDPGILHAVAAGLAWKSTEQNFPAIARYVDRLPPEFGMYLVTGACRRGAGVENTAAFQQWAANNSQWLT